MIGIVIWIEIRVRDCVIWNEYRFVGWAQLIAITTKTTDLTIINDINIIVRSSQTFQILDVPQKWVKSCNGDATTTGTDTCETSQVNEWVAVADLSTTPHAQDTCNSFNESKHSRN